MDLSQVSDYLATLGQPAFRFKQIIKNYYSGRYSEFSQMTDLPLGLRTELDQKYPLLAVKPIKILKSVDSQKAVLGLSDGLKIESVIMDYGEWLTVCVSSQVGCPLGCTFCATGKMGFTRDLTAEEIVDQIIFWNHQLSLSPLPQGEKRPKADKCLAARRVVFMGMGEPFLNWKNVHPAIKIINSKDGLNLGGRKISLSTAGIIGGIEKFEEMDIQVNLALSLHSADQKTREQLMPIAVRHRLPDLTDALNHYTDATRRQVFLEYALIKDVNDSPRHLRLLIDYVNRNPLFFLNLIPLNQVKGGLVPSEKMKLFETELTANHVNFSLRRSLGSDIASACGQLIIND